MNKQLRENKVSKQVKKNGKDACGFVTNLHSIHSKKNSILFQANLVVW